MEVTLKGTDEEGTCTKYKFAAGTMIFISFWAFWILLSYSAKFFRIYRFKNRCIFMFLIMINLSIFLRFAYFIQELVPKFISWIEEAPVCLDSTFTFLNIICFFSAATFYEFNWLYQISDIDRLLLRSRGCK